MRFLLMLTVALLMSGAAVPAVADPFEDAATAHGKGDYATALRLLRPIAEQGEAPAQLVLGYMYANGHGVPRDYVQAYMWLYLSAALGDAEATKNRDIVAEKLTPAQIAEAQKLAREWKPK